MRGAPHSTSIGACTSADSNGSVLSCQYRSSGGILLCRQHCSSGGILYLAWGSLKTIRVFVIVLVPDSEHEVFPFEVDLRYPRPKIVSNLDRSGMKEIGGYGGTLPCFYFWELWYHLVSIPGSTRCCPPLLLGGDPHHTYQATSPALQGLHLHITWSLALTFSRYLFSAWFGINPTSLPWAASTAASTSSVCVAWKRNSETYPGECREAEKSPSSAGTTIIYFVFLLGQQFWNSVIVRWKNKIIEGVNNLHWRARAASSVASSDGTGSRPCRMSSFTWNGR